jgi:hypothetical protein
MRLDIFARILSVLFLTMVVWLVILYQLDGDVDLFTGFLIFGTFVWGVWTLVSAYMRYW